MPKFKKSILPVGKYLVTRPNGSRTLKEFTKDYLTKVADNANDMIAAGLRIPAPFRHAKEAVPVEEIPETDSFDNAGYWEKVSLEDIDGVPTLCGIVDSPGSEEDFNSPAGKLAHRIKEVSACIVDNWTDGKNRNWGPSMLHGAAVVNPVVPDQEGFALLSFPDQSLILSASSALVDQSPEMDNIADLAKAFENIGIYLPSGTSSQDLVKVLLVSLKQHKLSIDQTSDDQEIVDTQSIFMSLPEGTLMPLSRKQAEELVSLGAINPKTKEAFKVEDFDVDDSPSPENQYALALTSQLTEEKKHGLFKRVNTLIETGRTTKEYADTKLIPEVEKYTLSLGDNAVFQPNAIDMLVDSLEALPGKEAAEPSVPSLMSNGIPTSHSMHEGDPAPVELSAEQAESMKNEFLKQLV